MRRDFPRWYDWLVLFVALLIWPSIRRSRASWERR